MALNTYMHPRNIYKTPPDFAKLAKEFKDFSQIAKVDVSGKFSIDFKNPKTLRVLTKCLLKSDFNIDIEIPENRLVPTLPLRLNYILWIEDLLKATQMRESVIGLDIGTGASAIYPIIASVKNKWHMVGTESDEESFTVAKMNVEKNNLAGMVKLIKNDTASILDFMLQDENVQIYNFCMCNPPFYCNLQDLWESRSPARPHPKNGFTGSPQELITEGGELQFCRKIISESKFHKDRILIFTTMVGHKYNLKELVIDMKADGIKYTTTEFCQGRVTRWGLAWTFQQYDIMKIVPPRDKARKRNTPIIFSLPKISGKVNDIQSLNEKLDTIWQSLKIKHNLVKKSKYGLTYDILAFTNTWTNQRRKRRLEKRIQESETKKIKMNTENNEPTVINSPLKIEIVKEIRSEPNKSKNENDKATVSNSRLDIDFAKEIASEPDNPKRENEINGDFVIHAITNIKYKHNEFSIEMEYLDGSAGKDGVHQIIQYIKNNWK